MSLKIRVIIDWQGHFLRGSIRVSVIAGPWCSLWQLANMQPSIVVLASNRSLMKRPDLMKFSAVKKDRRANCTSVQFWPGNRGEQETWSERGDELERRRRRHRWLPSKASWRPSRGWSKLINRETGASQPDWTQAKLALICATLVNLDHHIKI